ncbi:acyltransferase family protein [Enterococcus faecalis]|uniref:acyltransferase family protein n=1 Tax=Enterococcus faecalis TaxID=1351 RepID=UPI00345B6B00
MNNAKGILIFLVVFAHFLEIGMSHYIPLFVFIYSFHMPLFVMISGYLSKRIRLNKIVRIAILLLIFQIFFVLMFKYFGYVKVTKISAMTVPVYQLWYLLSLVVWYLIVFGLNRIQNRTISILIIILLVGISLSSRYFTMDIAQSLVVPNANGYTFGFQRTLSFFPYFILGYALPKDIMQKIYDLKPSFAKLIFIPFFLIVAYLGAKVKNINLLFLGSFGFSEIDLVPHLSPMNQLYIVYLIIPALCLGILNIIPSKKNLFTKLGSRTLPIFILHPIFILIGFHFKDIVFKFPVPIQLLIWFLFAVVTTILTGNEYIVLLFKSKQKNSSVTN